MLTKTSLDIISVRYCKCKSPRTWLGACQWNIGWTGDNCWRLDYANQWEWVPFVPFLFYLRCSSILKAAKFPWQYLCFSSSFLKELRILCLQKKICCCILTFTRGINTYGWYRFVNSEIALCLDMGYCSQTSVSCFFSPPYVFMWVLPPALGAIGSDQYGDVYFNYCWDGHLHIV